MRGFRNNLIHAHKKLNKVNLILWKKLSILSTSFKLCTNLFEYKDRIVDDILFGFYEFNTQLHLQQ